MRLAEPGIVGSVVAAFVENLQNITKGVRPAFRNSAGNMSKPVSFLGHPAYALFIIILSMPVLSGLGTYFSRRVIGDSDKRWSIGLVAVTVLAFIAGTIFIAIYFGLRETLLFGGLLYLGALLVVRMTSVARHEAIDEQTLSS